MKKSFFAFSIICSLFLFSCASKNQPLPQEEVSAPEVSDIQEIEEPSVITLPPLEEAVDIQEEKEGPETQDEGEITPPEEYYDESQDLEIIENQEAQESENEIAETEPDQESVNDPDTVENVENSSENSQTSENSEMKENPTEIEVTDSSSDDITVTDENFDLEGNSFEEESEEIVPSRKVTLKKQEYLDVDFPGQGWVYMGLTDGSKDLIYFGRKLGTENTRFTLQARNAGVKILHFYKNDALSGEYIDDYIEVEILAEKGSNKNHIQAPEYKQQVPKKAKELLKNDLYLDDDNSEEVETIVDKKKEESKQNSVSEEQSKEEFLKSENTENENEPAIIEESDSNKDSSSLLQEAKVLYNEKEYALALQRLSEFYAHAEKDVDQGLYLEGQILEAKSEIQDIKAAIEAYTKLTKNYPASSLWDSANKRIIYLKRFYLEVR